MLHNWNNEEDVTYECYIILLHLNVTYIIGRGYYL